MAATLTDLITTAKAKKAARAAALAAVTTAGQAYREAKAAFSTADAEFRLAADDLHAAIQTITDEPDPTSEVA